MPLGAVVTRAAANEGQQVGLVLEAMVLQPPRAETPVERADMRDLPSVKADGAYGNSPTTQRAAGAGFRMRAPKRGQTRTPGIGRVRCAVERGHSFLSQFGRVVRRYDRCNRRYLGWVEMAACIIFIRGGFFL